MPRLAPLTRAQMSEFEHLFVAADALGREVPNLVRTMARRPEILKAHQALRKAVMGPGTVPEALKNLVAQMASNAAGCNYCSAHTVYHGIEMNMPADKQAALFDFETSPLFEPAERAALTVARGAGQLPNQVTDGQFAALRSHFSDEQVVEILAVIGMFGYFNRINDTLATELEAAPICAAERFLAPHGWTLGKHGK